MMIHLTVLSHPPCDRIPSFRSVESLRTAGYRALIKGVVRGRHIRRSGALVVPRGDVIGKVGIVLVQKRIHVSHGGHSIGLPLRIHKRHECCHHRDGG